MHMVKMLDWDPNFLFVKIVQYTEAQISMGSMKQPV